MSKAAVIYNLADDSIVGVVQMSPDNTIDLYPEDPTTQGVIEIALNHPIIFDTLGWIVQDRQLVKI